MMHTKDNGCSSKNRLDTLLCAIVVLGALLGTAIATDSQQNRHFSTKDGRVFRMQPSGATFELPEGPWNDWHMDRAELDKVKRGKGEWYTEYARIANAAISFESCSVQAGTTYWNGASFSGVTVRGYSLNSAAGEADTRIASRALRTAQHLPRNTVGNASLTKSRVNQWDRLLIAYDVWYEDYGGRANVDFYVTEVAGKTIVLVFMYVDANSNSVVVRQILESFSMH